MHQNEDLHFEEFASRHDKFMRSLESFPEQPIPGTEMRGYQRNGIQKVRDDILSGKTKGQFILGTGGGKTTISKALIAGTEGRTLYVGPSRVSAAQGKNEFDKRQINKSSQILNEQNPFRTFDQNAEVTYGTAQMFIYDDRYKSIDPDHFDMLIFDEAHHFLGKKFSQLSEYFTGGQIFMTATPGNMRTHLRSLAPHKFFEYSSNDLINNEGFPEWRVFRHEVKDEHFERATIVGDKFQMEGNEASVLNLPHRFAIARDLFLESVAKGERRLAFMPSVASSKEFVDTVVAACPALIGKIVHVDGDTKNIKAILEAFKRGDILGVCCKDLWNESLDIPEIAAITLADPSLSERVIMQRCGRGARPSEGKSYLRIDDIVNCIPNMTYASSRPLTMHGILGLKKYIPGAPVNGPEAVKIYKDNTTYETIEVPFNERHLAEDMAFIRNPQLGAALMKEFARVFGTSVVNLFTQPAVFYKRSEKVTIESHDGATFDLDFEDAHKAAILFGSIRRIEDEVLKSVEVNQKKVAEKIEGALDRVKSPFPKKLNFELLDWNGKYPPLLPISPEKKALFNEIWNDLQLNLKKGMYLDKEILEYYLNERIMVKDLGYEFIEEFWFLVVANTKYYIKIGNPNNKEPLIRFVRPLDRMDDSCDSPRYKAGAKKARFFDRMLMGCVYKPSSTAYDIISELREEGIQQDVPYSKPIRFSTNIDDTECEKAINDVIEQCRRQEIYLSCEKIQKGETMIFNITVKFDQEHVEENARGFEKAMAFKKLKFEDKEVDRLWKNIFAQLPFESHIALGTGFYEEVNANMADKTRYGEKDKSLIIDYRKFGLIGSNADPFVTIRRLELELKKMGIEIKFDCRLNSAFVTELNANNFNPDYADRKSDDCANIRDIYFAGFNPDFLASESFSHFDEEFKKTAGYSKVLELAEIVLAKFREGDEFEIPVDQMPDLEICEKIFERLMEDLDGNLGMMDTKFEFKNEDGKFKFKTIMPDEARMQNWNRGRLKHAALRDVSFGHDFNANKLWHELMEQFAHVRTLDRHFFDDFDRIYDDASNATIAFNHSNKIMLENMQKLLAEKGIRLEFTQGDEKFNDTDQYWFAINVDEMKVPEGSVLSTEEEKKLALVKRNLFSNIDENYFGRMVNSHGNAELKYDMEAVLLMNDKLFATMKTAGKFILSEADFKVKNPQMYLEYFASAIYDIGPRGFDFEFKKIEDGYECEFVFPGKDEMFDWDENRRIWEMARGISFRDSKVNNLWVDIQTAFFGNEVQSKAMLFNSFKENCSSFDENLDIKPAIRLNLENRELLESIRVNLLDKFNIKFFFDGDWDTKVFTVAFDLKETKVVLQTPDARKKGLTINMSSVIDGQGAWIVD